MGFNLFSAVLKVFSFYIKYYPLVYLSTLMPCAEKVDLRYEAI
jgi:hypothetical protein